MSKLKNLWKETPLHEHVVADFIVNNSIANDDKIEEIRTLIFKTGQKERHSGELIPIKWVHLEKEIMKKRDKGTRVLQLHEIRSINMECEVTLKSNDEIEDFLRFHNAMGNIMFFGGKKADNIVIIDPQWLIDALKKIITHNQFYYMSPCWQDDWDQFIGSAILSKKLIEYIWLHETERSFFENRKALLDILDSTDIISKVKVYDNNGKLQEQKYVLVPSMLKPNDASEIYLSRSLEHYKTRTPSLCFVFKENFMPPAIFPRLQAACTGQYSIKQIDRRFLLFHQYAVFKLSSTCVFCIEQVQHAIRITVMSTQEGDILSHMCQCLLLFLEEKLKDIVQLYRRSMKSADLPYYKAIQCSQMETKLGSLHLLDNQTEEMSDIICTKHDCEFVSRIVAMWSDSQVNLTELFVKINNMNFTSDFFPIPLACIFLDQNIN